MSRWRAILLGLLLLALVACGGATTTSNQSLADPTTTAVASGAAAPSTAARASTAPGASVAPPASAAPRTNASVAPSASAAPRASAAAVASASAPLASRTPSAAVGAVPQPNGTIPAGWKVFRGPRDYPFVMAYPPDWTVDESYFPGQSIIFFIGPSGNTDEESVAIIWGAQQTEANIDVLLDDLYQQKSTYCEQEGIEFTERRQISDATFAILGASCDQGGVLFFLQVGAGLKQGDQWDIEMRTTYERKEAFRRTIFDPMLASLNIYAQVPR